jgi:hypothetical protein
VGSAGAFAAGGAVAQCCILARRGPEPELRCGQRPGCYRQDRRLEHTYIYTDAHAFPECNGYVYAYAHTDQHTHPDAYVYSYADRHRDPHEYFYKYSHTDINLHTNTYAYVHANTSAAHT